MFTYIFGHKNPDTDSVASAISFSYFKNQLGYSTIPCVLGSMNKESEYILDYFKLPTPKLLTNVKTQVKDLNFDMIQGVAPHSSILNTYRLMANTHQKTLPVLDPNNKLLGIITTKDIAMQLITGDFHHLHTSLSNIVETLDGKILVGDDFIVEGNISVIAFYYKSIAGLLNRNSIIIVGDRYDIIEHAIRSKVQLIIVTGGKNIPTHCLRLAKQNNVTIISVAGDTYTTSNLIHQCNDISSIIRSKNLIKFNKTEYLEDIKDEIINTNHINYPIVDDNNVFLGFINRKHILKPSKKKVILVDHNEYSQSVEGLQESEILEIIDHHKLGDICTTRPINFRNMPVGSTCTIVYRLFKEYNIDIPNNIAGLILSGILSDTLFFKSPTTTSLDKLCVEELNDVLKLDLEKFAMNMFKAGSSLEGQNIEEIFYKDFKEFVLEEKKIGIGQVFTLDIDDVLNRKEAFTEYMNTVHNSNDYFLTLLLITDILKEGSYLLFKCNHNNFISTSFGVQGDQGVFAPNILSRKKQVLPKVSETLSNL